MLESFTRDTFQPHVGQPFRVIVDETYEMRATLADVSTWGDESAQGRTRAPFTLTFSAPPRTVIPQAIYRIESEVMGPFELFLVPISTDDSETRYEAVFT